MAKQKPGGKRPAAGAKGSERGSTRGKPPTKRRKRIAAKQSPAFPSGFAQQRYYFDDRALDRCNLRIARSTGSHKACSPVRQQAAPFAPPEHDSGPTNIAVGPLSRKETKLWSSPLGAAYASKGSVPGHLGRKLGRITRILWLPGEHTRWGAGAGAGAKHDFVRDTDRTHTWNSTKLAAAPTMATARKEARRELLEGHSIQPNHHDSQSIEQRSRAIVRDWKESLQQSGVLSPNWNRLGFLPRLPIRKEDVGEDPCSNPRANSHNHCRTDSITAIREMLEHPSCLWRDDPRFANEGAFQKLYHLRIPVDTPSVLRALEALAKPDRLLYNLPLVVAVPVLEPLLDYHGGEVIDRVGVGNPEYSNRSPWKLTIAMYAHRLLFECMTTGALQTVMAALDSEESAASENTFLGFHSILRPMEKSPAVGPIVFGKDPNTKVEIIADQEHDSYETGDESSVVDLEDGNQGRTRTNDTLDAFSTEGFLKLIENQGVAGADGEDGVYQTTIEPVLYGGSKNGNNNNNGDPLLRVSLLPHQVHGVSWMYQMEHLGVEEETHAIGMNRDSETTKLTKATSQGHNPSLGLNGLLWERRRFQEGDVFYYSPALGQARLTLGSSPSSGTRSAAPADTAAWRQHRSPRGGILADEMGLGKTVQAVALVLATLGELKREKEMLEAREAVLCTGDTKNGHRILVHSHATLIIVPPALVGQWRNEIHKIAGSNLRVQFLDHKEAPIDDTDTGQQLELDLAADVVLTTYQSLEGGKKRKSSRKANQVSEVLSSTAWGRIILDEMQEIRSWNTVASKQCQQLMSDRRWMLSGTPLWEGIEDFKGELCFLGLEPFAASNEDGFFDFAIGNHWEARSKHGLEILRILALIVLRRTKSMTILESGLPLLGLKNLTLEFEPVPQDPPERALYCFLESVMHTTLARSARDVAREAAGERVASAMQKKRMSHRSLFLRLLRQLCVSPYLLNGGLDCTSQLKDLNRLMKEYNRKRLEDGTLLALEPKKTSGKTAQHEGLHRLYSCDEAVQFLSQVEDAARTDSDFVTDQRVGGGAGISRRNRALLIDPREKLEASKEQIARSTEICRAARSSRARARWHWALEGVTTGRALEFCQHKAVLSPSMVSVWTWRRNNCATNTPRRKAGGGTATMASLCRGFRPTPKFFCRVPPSIDSDGGRERTSNGRNVGNSTGKGRSKPQKEREEKLSFIYESHPEFRWAHPFSFIFSHIPIQVSMDQLQKCIEDILAPPATSFAAAAATASKQAPIAIFRLRESKDTQTWEAIVHFPNRKKFEWFENLSKRVNGTRLPRIQAVVIPCIEEEIATTKKKVEDAEAMRIVHPSTQNERNLTKAKAAHERAKMGLCVMAREHHRTGHILCSRAFGTFRGAGPKSCASLENAVAAQIEASTADLAEHTSIIHRETKTIQSIEGKIAMNTNRTTVVNLNTFEVLQALKKGDTEKTNCPICYDTLGNGDGSHGKVYLTRCGHLSCKCCLNHWINQKERQGSTISCIECRKRITRNQLICVDPKKVDQDHLMDSKQKARALVKQAAKMLEENFGKLKPHLWEALYLVIDLPPGIDQDLDESFTAIPGLFLAHLRHFLRGSMPLGAPPNFPAGAVSKGSNECNLSSKFRALLSDLPRNELSVVFASSKSIVLHLKRVLETKGFTSKTLFVGQSEEQSECAISDWEDSNGSKNPMVLIVQAGAAACGLTLTAASKMFILEPFRKHEEEKQAYARLHRYGQTREVHCKVYYTPVSVESRLLEWRRRATAHSPEEEKTVYAPLRQNDECKDEDDGTDGKSTDQSQSNERSADPEENASGIEDENQIRFLLGIDPPLATTTSTSTVESTTLATTAESSSSTNSSSY